MIKFYLNFIKLYLIKLIFFNWNFKLQPQFLTEIKKNLIDFY